MRCPASAGAATAQLRCDDHGALQASRARQPRPYIAMMTMRRFIAIIAGEHEIRPYLAMIAMRHTALGD